MTTRSTRWIALTLASALIASVRWSVAAPGLYTGVGYLDEGEIRREIERRTQDIARAQARIAQIETKIASLTPAIAASEAACAAQVSRARQAIILHDRMARGGWLRMALSTSTLTDLAVLGRLYSRMLERESSVLAGLEEREEALEAQRETLDADRQMLGRLRADLDAHRKALDARRKTLLALESRGYVPAPY